MHSHPFQKLKCLIRQALPHSCLVYVDGRVVGIDTNYNVAMGSKVCHYGGVELWKDNSV